MLYYKTGKILIDRPVRLYNINNLPQERLDYIRRSNDIDELVSRVKELGEEIRKTGREKYYPALPIHLRYTMKKIPRRRIVKRISELPSFLSKGELKYYMKVKSDMCPLNQDVIREEDVVDILMSSNNVQWSLCILSDRCHFLSMLINSYRLRWIITVILISEYEK